VAQAAKLSAAAAAPAAPFHGNEQSHVYHAASCRQYECKSCTRVFQTEAEAQRAGFKPAADCLR
jgi:methylphosphotriester-DNA--protein-cysteine methyltransferase